MNLKEIAAALRCYHLNDLPEDNPIRRARDALLEAHDRITAAEAEAAEQARLLGISGTVVAALRALLAEADAQPEPHIDGWPLYSGLPPAVRPSAEPAHDKADEAAP